MQDLKLALGKQKAQKKDSPYRNKQKGESMWVMGEDSQQQQTDLYQSSKGLGKFLKSCIIQLKQQQEIISETAFDEIFLKFQKENNQEISQVACLLLMQDKLTDIMENFEDEGKYFLGQFHKMIETRIDRKKKQAKKHELQQFEQIIQKNFKKKQSLKDSPLLKVPTFASVNSVKQRQKSGQKLRQKSRQKDRQNHQDKALNKLLNKEKLEQKEQMNHTQYEAGQDGTSYSAVFSASCAVKHRNRPRRNTKKGKQLKEANKVQEQQENQEKAFIFYRPKKGK